MKISSLCILVLAMSGFAEAAVITTIIPDPEGLATYWSHATRRRGMDLNQDGTEDFHFVKDGPFYTMTLGMTDANRITGFGYGEGALDLGGFATSMPPLSVIGAETPQGAEWWNDAYGAAVVSGFVIGEGDYLPFLFGLHYVGLEFRIGEFTHYGYVKFEGTTGRINMLETAWETEPGQSITIPVPEPAVGTCLAACFAAAGWRRRRGALGFPLVSAPGTQSNSAIL